MTNSSVRVAFTLIHAPERRPPLVQTVLALSDDAFEATRQRGALKRNPVVVGVHELHARRRKQALRQVTAAIGVRASAQIRALEVQQIEAIENCVGGLRRAAVLERRKGRLSRVVESDDLAIEDHRLYLLRRQFGRQQGEISGQI